MREDDPLRAANTSGTHSRGGGTVMESGRPGEVLSNPQHSALRPSLQSPLTPPSRRRAEQRRREAPREVERSQAAGV